MVFPLSTVCGWKRATNQPRNRREGALEREQDYVLVNRDQLISPQRKPAKRKEGPPKEAAVEKMLGCSPGKYSILSPLPPRLSLLSNCGICLFSD